ncbi:MAG: class I SAM-dependent methyltransferase [Verrucomicrobia bacterium]|nr:class I SAM-dependent methyltransferase [Verrucomicrobiota bacterium]
MPGFLNVDARAGDEQVDLAAGNLPWDNGVFDVIVGQHVIEHFDLVSELIPLLRELRRVSKDGAEIWLSCPDMEKVCRSYVNGTLGQLIADREKRLGDLDLGQAPDQHMVNFLFHQWGEHRNLFDFGLLKWALEQTGFGSCTRTSEKQFLGRFPSFPPRKDDLQSLYVHATAGIAEGMKPR